MEIWKTAARADGKAIHNLMEKDKPFPQVCKQLSHSLTILAVYTHSHNAYYGGYRFLPYPILMRKYYGNSFSTEVQFVPLFTQQNRVKVI